LAGDLLGRVSLNRHATSLLTEKRFCGHLDPFENIDLRDLHGLAVRRKVNDLF
jgi:hypothetical protein